MKLSIPFLTPSRRVFASMAALLLAIPVHGFAKDKDKDDDDHRHKKKGSEKVEDHKKSDDHKKAEDHHKTEDHKKPEVHHKVEEHKKEEEHHKVEVHHDKPEIMRKTEVHHDKPDVVRKTEIHHSKDAVVHHARHSDEERRKIFVSRPKKTYIVSYGNGYAGRGYYYGPRGASYYYEIPGVVFYGERRAIPREYTVVDESYRLDSVDARVQRALSYEGYYNGPIDGDIGPGSRAAIARFQRDNGLDVTGTINGDLLDALDIEG